MDQSICNEITTDMLETSIINAIKAIWAIKKRPDKRSICDLIEMGKVENKSSNSKSSYFLIECKATISDGINLPNS